MLHELLLALNGHTGGIFVDRGKSIEVVGTLPFLHPSEVTLLNQLLSVGTDYRAIQRFINTYNTEACPQEESSQIHGMYLHALCIGLDEVVEPYREELVQLERDILRDPFLPLIHIQCRLQKYKTLFQYLLALTDQVERQKVHGLYILGLVYRHTSCGVSYVKDAIKRVLHSCHIVLYKQLTAWLLYGLLVDPYNEFFIEATRLNQEASETGDSEKQILKDDVELYSKPDFTLRAEMLPTYIPCGLAQKILFIGESVLTLGQKQNKMSELSVDVSCQQKNVFQDQEEEFVKALARLQQLPDFSLIQFQEVIGDMRSCVAEHFWRLMMEEADLKAHLKIVKLFYLLGRGELFLEFIIQANKFLRAPPTGISEHTVNEVFQMAARKILQDDESIESFHLCIRKTKVKGISAQEVSGWDCLNLQYTVSWPLHILLSPAVLDKYNTIFKFLLLVKRVQWHLHSVWALQMQHKHLGIESREPWKWQLRSHMAFLVDHLQYYLHVDVLDSQYSLLQSKIKATKDFEEIRLAHDIFLTNVLSQAFLLTKPVHHCLKEILRVCHTFCMLVSQASMPMTTQEVAQVETCFHQFGQQSALLFQILSSLRHHQAGSHLSRLMLRIDFNNYFSQNGKQLGRLGT